MSQLDMGAAWDRASREYLSRRDPAVDIVTYGALAPDEETLHLLGPLHDRRILDFGCGGGHNAIACALAGAHVTGVDISSAQLRTAKRLAAAEDVDITWLHGGAEQLAQIDQVDLILSIHVFTYIADLSPVFHACRQALTPAGHLVVAVDHPIRTAFWDDETEDVGPVAMRPYDDATPITWHFDPQTPMQSYPRTTADWIAHAAACGLQLQRMIEPLVPDDMRESLWPEDSPLAPLRELPHTLIMLFTPAPPTTHSPTQ